MIPLRTTEIAGAHRRRRRRGRRRHRRRQRLAGGAAGRPVRRAAPATAPTASRSWPTPSPAAPSRPSSPEGTDGERLIRVADPLMALGRIAAALRDRSAARVVGITGSTGKTTTKDILRALVEPHAAVVASRENENNELGVPLTVCAATEDTDVIVAEMAMRGIGQIAYLAEIVRPDVAVITSIGPVHLEFLGTVERVAEAKAEILHHVAAGGAAVVPDDEPLLAPHLAGFDGRVVTFGEGEGADVRLAGFQRSGSGGEAEIVVGGRTLHVPVNFASRHDARNLAAATAAYGLLDLPLDGLAEGAGTVRFSRWRGEQIELPDGGLLIADCYNANPVSMRAALAHLVEVADGRRTVAVLGAMAELGPSAPELHREVGAGGRPQRHRPRDRRR